MVTENKSSAPLYNFDDVVVDREDYRVLKGGQVRTLTPRAFDVLLYLIEHRGRVLGKQELFEQVWKDAFVTDNALTRAVKEVRRAIGDDADAPRYIETVQKRGYRFIAEVRAAGNVEREAKDARRDDDESVVPENESRATAAAERPSSKTQPEVDRVSTGRLPNRTRLLIAVGACVFLAAVALTWRMVRQTSGPVQPSTLLKATQVTYSSGLDIFPTLSPDGNFIAYSSDRGGQFELYVKQLTPGGREIQLTADGEQNFEPAWSPDGRQIAFYSKKRGGIWLMPALGGPVRQLTEFGSRPAWSSDGSMIAFQSGELTDLGATAFGSIPPSTIWAVPEQGGAARQITQVGNPPGGHSAPSWSPDGRRVVFCNFHSGTSQIWSASAGGGDLKPLTPDEPYYYDPFYSPSGEYVYYASLTKSSNFGLWKVRVSPDGSKMQGQPAEVSDMGAVRIRHLRISPDGKRVVYSTVSGTSNLLSIPLSLATYTPAGPPVPLTGDASYRHATPAFSPDGRKIAFVLWREGANADVWVMDSDGKNLTQLTTNSATDYSPTWFPDGDQIAFLSNRDGHFNLWSVSLKSGRERLLLDVAPGMGQGRLSSDGKQFAFNSNAGGVINVSVASLEDGQSKQLTFDKELMGFPYWSPDGKYLVAENQRGSDINLVLIPSGGGTPTPLTSNAGLYWTGGFSPDGDKVASACYRDGAWNVWWVSRADKTQRQLTNFTRLNSYVRYPVWSPDGRQIVFEYAETTGNIWVADLK